MESIVVYVQDSNTSYRINLPTAEICRLCLELSVLKPIHDSLFAKDFDDFYFIGVRLGYSMPKHVCKTCLSHLNQVGELLKKWQGSLYTYKKMEDNCAKVKQSTTPSVLLVSQPRIVTQSQDVCETTVVTKSEEEEESEMTEIVSTPEKAIELELSPISNVDIPDESDDILDIKTEVSNDADEILRIETEPPDESLNSTVEVNNSETQTNSVTADMIKSGFIEPQLNSDSVDLKSEPVPPCEGTKSSKKSKSKTEPTQKICHKCGACVMSLTQHYKRSYQCQSRNYKCPMCNVYVNNTVKLLDHQRAYHWDQISATRFTCHICGQTFKYRCSLKRHLMIHEKGKQYMCEFCGKSYTRATDLRDHKNTHLDLRPYVCQCGKTFMSKAALYTHSTKHSDKDCARRQWKPRTMVDLDLVCNICERHFSRQDFLDKHMRSHGEDTRLRECRKCKIKFETVEEYREHAETHAKRTHLCSYCSKSFRSAVILEQHTFTHTGERPYLCSLCGTKFRAPAHLRRHNMLIHNINRGKPFKCKYCEKTFALKENLLPHERIHTGEKPYKCHVCEKYFIDPSRRKKHVRRYHGEEEVKKIQTGVNK